MIPQVDTAVIGTIDARTKRLPNSAYKLQGLSYGMDVVLPDRIDLDQAKMSAWVPYADGRNRDGVGDLLEVGGIRTERHVKNPVVLFDHGKGQHKWANWPIGLAEDPDTLDYTNNIDPIGQQATLNAFFYQGKGMVGVEADDEKAFAIHCLQIYDLLAKRYIRGGSIGYQIIQAEQMPPDYAKGTPAGAHLKSVLMLEGSVVVMPANMDTVRGKHYGDEYGWVNDVLCMPKLCGYALSPVLVKSLEAYAPERPVQMGYEKGLSTDNPSGIPPAKWKPGLGAVKELKKKYRPATKTLRRRVKSSRAGGTMIHVAEKDLAEAEKLATEKGLKFTRIGFAGKAVKVKLVGDDALADEIATKCGIPLRRGKSMGTHTKSVTVGQYVFIDIMVGSVPPSKITVRGKVTLVRPDGMLEVKTNNHGYHIVSPNEARETKSIKGDTMPKQVKGKTKDLPPDPNVQDETPADAETKDVDMDLESPGEAVPDSKYSSQLLRRVHEDFGLLLQEYDKLNESNEHPEISEYIRNLCQEFVGKLEEIEEMHGTHHPDATPVGEKDLDEAQAGDEEAAEAEAETEGVDTDVVPSSSGEGEKEVPDPEEVVEGMETKAMRRQLVKALRQVYGGKKSMPCASCKKEPCVCKSLKGGKRKALNWRGSPGSTMTAVGLHNNDYRIENENGVSVLYVGGLEWDDFDTLDQAKREAERWETNKTNKKHLKAKRNGKRKALPGDEADQPVEGAEDFAPEDIPGTPGDEAAKSWQDHERAAITEAAGFAKELAEAPELSDEHRFKSFHYHKALEPLGDAEEEVKDMDAVDAIDAADADQSVQAPGEGKALTEDEADEIKNDIDAQMSDTEVKGFGHHKKNCGKASQFFKNVATEPAYSDSHRQEAMTHAKALEDAAAHQVEESQEGAEDAEAVVPGEMGEKAWDVVNRRGQWWIIDTNGDEEGPFHSEIEATEYGADNIGGTPQNLGKSAAGAKALQNLKALNAAQQKQMADAKAKLTKLLAAV